MDMRRAKAEQIAKMKRIQKKEKGWEVPSQSGHGSYSVAQGGAGMTCTCPDFQSRGQPCKHIMAVELLAVSWFNRDGEKVAEIRRITYPQNWSAYNASQITEKDTFMTLMADLCENVDDAVIPLGKAGRH